MLPPDKGFKPVFAEFGMPERAYSSFTGHTTWRFTVILNTAICDPELDFLVRGKVRSLLFGNCNLAFLVRKRRSVGGTRGYNPLLKWREASRCGQGPQRGRTCLREREA